MSEPTDERSPSAESAARIVEELRREGVPLKATEIRTWTGMTAGQVHRGLAALAKEGRAERNENGYWQLVHFHGGRTNG